ncbi:MAG: hypothetical protein JW881_04965 [Spirochaetales bacterium]|nr:hypothetical protein [Spirochaetales bacterium]
MGYYDGMNNIKEIIADALPRPILVNGKTFLGVPTGVRGSSFMLTKLSNMKHSPGMIVRGLQIIDWKFTGFTRVGEETFLYGPEEKGILLADLLDASPKDLLPLLEKLVGAFNLLKERTLPLFRIYLHSVVFLNDGGVLFLPPDIMKEITDIRNRREKIYLKTIVTHPDLRGEQSISFCTAVLLYHSLTGLFPFHAEEEEEIHNRMRNLDVTTPKAAVPSLRDDVAAMIGLALDRKSVRPPSLDEWMESFEKWSKEGFERQLSDEELKRVTEEVRMEKMRYTASYRRKIFWQKNFRMILGIGIVSLVAFVFLGSIVHNIFFRTRATNGMSPKEVVEAYYRSINNLDPLTLGDCVVGNAGKDNVEVVTNLYVITRQRLAYEKTSFYISADEWDKKGRPELRPYTILHGVARLEISELHGEPDPAFLASYERWHTESEDAGSPGSSAGIEYFGMKVKERLYLRLNRGDWVIFNIDVIEETSLERQ